FQLFDPSGKAVDVAPQTAKQFTVVCFLGTECPLVRLYAPRLNKLASQFASQNIRFIGINSNSQDSPKEVAAFAKEFDLTFPILKDPGNKVADEFGARHMVEVFVLDNHLTVRYRGRVDDQYQPGVSRPQPTRHDLQVAIEELV